MAEVQDEPQRVRTAALLEIRGDHGALRGVQPPRPIIEQREHTDYRKTGSTRPPHMLRRRHAIDLEGMDPGVAAWFAQCKECWPRLCVRHTVSLPQDITDERETYPPYPRQGGLSLAEGRSSAAHTSVPTLGSRVYSSEQHPCPSRFPRSPSLSPLLFEGQRVCCRAGVRFSPFEVCESHEG